MESGKEHHFPSYRKLMHQNQWIISKYTWVTRSHLDGRTVYSKNVGMGLKCFLFCYVDYESMWFTGIVWVGREIAHGCLNDDNGRIILWVKHLQLEDDTQEIVNGAHIPWEPLVKSGVLFSRSRYQEQGEVITSRRYCGVQLIAPVLNIFSALGTTFLNIGVFWMTASGNLQTCHDIIFHVSTFRVASYNQRQQ